MIDEWRIWDHNPNYGELLYKRATGELKEMESSKSVCNVIKNIYKNGMRVLDVGCGAGHYLRSLRKRLDNNIDYTGTDVTENYLELASRAFPDVKFVKGNIFALPFDDNSFDIVMCNNVLLHLPPKIELAIAELLRVSIKYVIIRALFGERNYIIKEVADTKDKIHGTESLPILDGKPKRFNYFNMYTEAYYRSIIRNASVEIIKDIDWKPFDNIDDAKNRTATRIMGNCQVSGNLLLDWRFIVLKKDD